MYKHLNHKFCYLPREKFAVESCQDLATLYKTGMSVLYNAQCTHTD